MADRILVRRDTLANFASEGVVPLNGEPIAIIGEDGRTTSYAIGDGVSAVPQLPALSKGDKGDPGAPGIIGDSQDQSGFGLEIDGKLYQILNGDGYLASRMLDSPGLPKAESQPDLPGFGVRLGDRFVQILDGDGKLAGPLTRGFAPATSVDYGTPPTLTLTAPKSSTMNDLLVSIVNQASKYTVNTFYPQRFGTGPINGLGGIDQQTVRTPAAATLGLAADIACGTYNASVTGVPLATARSRAVDVIAALVRNHVANSGTWGGPRGSAELNSESLYGWQTALHAALAGASAWLLWGQLTAETRQQALAMIAWEADRMIGWKLPYYRDRSGKINFVGDSKGEEIAWDGGVVALACAMMPKFTRAKAWMTKLCEMGVAAHSLPSETTSAELSHGSPIGDLLDGSNLNQDGTVTNHSMIHPDYMVSAGGSMWPIASLLAASKQLVPASMLHGAANVYAALNQVSFSSPPYLAPGGTIYIPGSGDFYYPVANDWGTQRTQDKATMDVLAHVYGWDAGLTTPAQRWAELHLARQAGLQARFTTGQTYANTSEDTFYGAEQWVAHHAGFALLAISAPTPRTTNAVPETIAIQNQGA